MGRNKDYAGIIKDANEKMFEWDNMQIVPESVQMYREMLNNFYEDANKKVKNPDAFSARVQLTVEQEEELIDIAIGFLNESRADLSTYEDFLEDANRTATRQRNNITTMEDAINFLDKMNNYQNDAFLSSVLSSDQLLELYTEGEERGLSNKEIQDLIFIEYSGAGAEGESLYNQIWEALQEYDEDMGGWKFD